MRPVRPWDMLNPAEPRTPKIIADGRYDICRNCEHFMANMVCGECGCFMKAKVHLARASCPVGKWHQVEGVPE